MANFFKNKVINEVGTTDETLLSFGPTVRGTVIGMSLANLTASNILASVTVTDDLGNTGYYFKDVVIPPNSSLRAVNGGEKLIVAPSNILKIRASQPASLDVVMSYVEIQ
jgi:hypothetical protein